MMKVEIIRARPHHCGKMIRSLRLEHARAMAEIPLNDSAHAQLRTSFYASTDICLSLFINGQLAALGGVTGDAASAEGLVWGAVSQDASKQHPVIVGRFVFRTLRRILSTRRRVVAVLVYGDEKAVELAQRCGFELERDLAGDKRTLWKRAGARGNVQTQTRHAA